jgi:hypothetical protein
LRHVNQYIEKWTFKFEGVLVYDDFIC